MLLSLLSLVMLLLLTTHSIKKYGLNMLGSLNPSSGSKHLLIRSSYVRRPSQSLHQEDHVSIEQMDAGRKDFQAGCGDYKQGDGRECGEMAV